MTARRLALCTAALCTAALCTGAVLTAVPAAAEGTYGSLFLNGWFDTNANGVQDPGERPIRSFEHLTIHPVGGEHDLHPVPGQYDFYLKTGAYDVTMHGYRETIATPKRITVRPDSESGPVYLTYALVGRTFTGLAFEDQNIDGVRAQPEGGLAGVVIHSTQGSVRTDPSGHYRMPNMALPDRLWVDARPLGVPFALGPANQTETEILHPGQDSTVDSDFLAATGYTPYLGGSLEQTVRHIDVGYLTQPYAQSLYIDVQPGDPVRRGGTVTAQLTVFADGGVSASRRVEAYAGRNSGLRIVAVDGRGWRTGFTAGDTEARFYPTEPLRLGDSHTVTVTYRVTQDVAERPAVLFRLNDADANGGDVLLRRFTVTG